MKEENRPAPQISSINVVDNATPKDEKKSKTSKLTARRILGMMKPMKTMRLKKKKFERGESSRNFTTESIKVINSPKVVPSGLDEVEKGKMAVKDEQMRAYLTLAMVPETLVEEYLSKSESANESELVTVEEEQSRDIVEPDEVQPTEDEVTKKEGELATDESSITFLPNYLYEQFTSMCFRKW